jgi:hypothetical protein
MSKWEEFKQLLDFNRWDSFGHWLKNVINLVDDPIDNFKHWLNGEHKFFKFRVKIRLPDWLMRNRGNPDK